MEVQSQFQIQVASPTEVSDVAFTGSARSPVDTQMNAGNEVGVKVVLGEACAFLNLYDDEKMDVLINDINVDLEKACAFLGLQKDILSDVRLDQAGLIPRDAGLQELLEDMTEEPKERPKGVQALRDAFNFACFYEGKFSTPMMIDGLNMKQEREIEYKKKALLDFHRRNHDCFQGFVPLGSMLDSDVKHCSLCSGGSPSDICASCRKIVAFTETLPFYFNRLIKSRHEYVRKYKELNNEEKYVKWLREKKPYGRKVEVRVKRQGTKDYEGILLEMLNDPVVSRAQRRMTEFNNRKHNGDFIGSLMTWIRSVASWLHDNPVVQAVASTVFAMVIAGAGIYILTVKTKGFFQTMFKWMGVIGAAIGAYAFGSVSSVIWTSYVHAEMMRRDRESRKEMAEKNDSRMLYQSVAKEESPSIKKEASEEVPALYDSDDEEDSDCRYSQEVTLKDGSVKTVYGNTTRPLTEEEKKDLFGDDYESDPIKKHEGGGAADEPVSRVFEGLVSEVAKDLTQREADLGTYLFSSWKDFAGKLRDTKTVVDIIAPLAKSLTAALYEVLTGNPYLDDEDKVIVSHIAPVQEEIKLFNKKYVSMSEAITNDDRARIEAETIIKKVEATNLVVMKMKVPPRWLIPWNMTLTQMREWEIILTQHRRVAKTRVAPGWIAIYGPPSAGKSYMVKCLECDVFAMLQKVGVLPDKIREKTELSGNYGPDKTFSRSVKNEFWDGYKGQVFLRYDDLLQQTDPKVRAPVAFELIQVVNTEPFQLNMSTTEEKAGVYMTSRLVCSTSNDHPKHNYLGLMSNDAFYRRRTLVLRVRAKPGRKVCSVDDPEFRNGWLITVCDSFGKPLYSDVTWDDLVALVTKIVVQNYSESEAKLVPRDIVIDASKSDTMLSSLLASSKASLAKANREEIKKKGGKLFKDKDEFAIWKECYGDCKYLLESEDPEDLDCRVETIRSLKRSWFAENEKFWEGVCNYEEHYKNDFVSPFELVTHDIALEMQYLQKQMDFHWKDVSDWTVKKYNQFLEYCEEVKLRVYSDLSYDVIKSFVTSSAKKTMEWADNNKWKIVLAAMGFVTIVTAAAGAVAYFSSSKEEVFKHTEEDKQAKIQRQEARERRKGGNVFQERARNAQQNRNAKEWDMRIERVLAQKHLGASDLGITTLMTSNEYLIEAEGNLSVHHAQVTFIGGNLARTAKHVGAWLRNVKDKVVHLVQNNDKKFELVVGVHGVSDIKGSESSIICFSGYTPHRVIFHHAPTEKQLEEHFDEDAGSCVIHGCTMFSRLVTNPVLVAEDLKDMDIAMYKPYDDEDWGLYGKVTVPTLDGQSGAPVIVTNPKIPFKWIGDLSGGGKHTSYVSIVTQEEMYDAIDIGYLAWKRSGAKGANPWVLGGVYKNSNVEALEPEKTDLAENIRAEFNVKHGSSIPKVNPIRKSILAESLEREGWKTESLPTQVRRFSPAALAEQFGVECEDTVFRDPCDFFKSRISKPVLEPPPELEEVSIWEHLPTSKSGNYYLYHPRHVVYGHRSIGLNGIEMDTSPGYPWVGIKGAVTRKQIFGRRWEDTNPLVKSEIERILEISKSDAVYMPIYTLSLKIERKPEVKVLRGETRAFMAGDVAFQVAGLTVCADANRIFKENASSMITYGINPHSSEWGLLATRLRKHPNYMATDASNWDFSQQLFIIMKACAEELMWISTMNVVDLSGDFQLGDHLDKIFEKVTMATGVSYILFKQVVYVVYKAIRSGNFKTTEFNCLINALCWRLVFTILGRRLGKIPKGWRAMDYYAENVEDAFVGDDCVLSVSDQVKDWFNQITCEPIWLDTLGIKLTDCVKGPIDRPFIPWADVRIIKRAFVYRDGWWYAPLPEQVIKEMCMWCSDPAFEASIVKETCTSATLEAAHLGKDFYDSFCVSIARACASKLPFRPITYEACVGNFRT